MPSWFRRWKVSGQKDTRQSRRYRPRVEGLEDRCLLAAPVIDPIANVMGNVPAGKSLIVPITGSDADGNALTYTVTSSDPSISAQLRTGNTFLRMSVANFGDLTFELFNDITPQTVQQITSLVNSGFYNNLIFHRVLKDFVIQGGDPNGNGSGGPGFSFDDEFNADAIFSGNGQLAMANSGKDTNGSQFFVTIGPERRLDFNHTIFGQLVRGFDVLDAIRNVPTDSADKPITPVVISSASIVEDRTDAVVTLKAAAGSTASSTITLTASDGTGESTTRTFVAQAFADDTNDPPFLNPIANQTTPRNTPVTFPVTGSDLENDPLTAQATVLDSPAHATATVSGGIVTVTPEVGFVGTINLQIALQQIGATGRGSTSDPRDLQKITVTVTNTDAPLTAQGANLSTTPNVPFTNVTVATFTDADPTGKLGDYTATIDWGDNTTTPGTVQAGTNGGFAVVGSHTYSTEGTFSVKSTITGTPPASDVTPSTVTATGTATLSSTPPTDNGNNGNTDNGNTDNGTGNNNGGTDGNNGGTTPPATGGNTGGTGTTQTPTVALTSNQRFLTNAYKDLLQRDIEPAALQLFSTMLDQGQLTRVQILLGIMTSVEHRVVQVNNIFLQHVGRVADQAPLAASVQFLMAGGNEATLRGIILGSPEYAQNRGQGSDATFVTSLFRDALGRDVDPSGGNTFTNALQAGASHLQIAQTVYNSPEGANLEVIAAYQRLLGRDPTANELSTFSPFLQNGGGLDILTAALGASAEYAAKQ